MSDVLDALRIARAVLGHELTISPLPGRIVGDYPARGERGRDARSLRPSGSGVREVNGLVAHPKRGCRSAALTIGESMSG